MKRFLFLLLPSLLFGQMNLQNNTVKISATGDLKYQFIHISLEKDTSIVIDCTGDGVFTKVLPKFVAGYGIQENEGFTFAGDSITVITPGDYWSIVNLTTVGNNAIDFELGLFKNSIEVKHVLFSGTGATNYIPVTLFRYHIGLVAGDDLCLKITNRTAPYTADPTLSEISWYVEKKPED